MLLHKELKKIEVAGFKLVTPVYTAHKYVLSAYTLTTELPDLGGQLTLVL